MGAVARRFRRFSSYSVWLPSNQYTVESPRQRGYAWRSGRETSGASSGLYEMLFARFKNGERTRAAKPISEHGLDLMLRRIFDWITDA